MSTNARIEELERKLEERDERIETLEERLEALEGQVNDNRFALEKKLTETNKRVTILENLRRVDALDLEANLTPLERMLIGQDDPNNVVEERALTLMENWDKIVSRGTKGKQSATVGKDPIKAVIERERDEDLSPRLLHRVLNAFDAKDADHGEGMELLGDKAKVDKTDSGRKRIKINDPAEVFFNEDQFQTALRERDVNKSMEQKLAENSDNDS